MEAIPDAVNTEALLAHADWVRALARTLVADPNRADDVAQDAWVAALESPPRDARNVRGWFARVVRNAASQSRRSETRRTAREKSVAREEALPETAELVARASLQRDLVGHVVALDEPYRRTILLRFFQGLEVREIAHQEGIELSTVRTRLQRSIAKLRERLDREHGERSIWLPAVAALARAPVRTELLAASSSAGLVAWTLGIAACLGIVGAIGWRWHDDVRPEAQPIVASSEADPRAALIAEPDPRSTLAPVDVVDRSPVDSSAQSAAASAPSTGSELPRTRIEGRVVDLRGHPLPGLRVRAHDPELPRRDGEWIHWRTGATTSTASPFPDDYLKVIREYPEELEHVLQREGNPPGLREVLLGVDLSASGTTATDGSFDLEASGTGLRVASDDEAWVFACDGWIQARTVHLFVAAPAIDVGGTVVDASAAPVHGASVEFGTVWPALEDFPIDLEGSGGGNSWQVSSGTDGRFRLARIPSIPGAGIRAWKEGFTTAVAAEPDCSDDGVTIVLAREAPRVRPHVRGIVLDERGDRVAKAWVQLGQDGGASDDTGAFDLELTTSPNEGTPLTAVLRGKQGAVVERFDEELAGRPEGVDGVVLRLGGEPLTITGAVLDAEGHPCPGWKVDLDDGTPYGTYHGVNIEGATLGRMNDREIPSTDARGRFELGGLRDRSYRIRAWDPSSCLVLIGEPVAAGARDVEVRAAADAVRPVVRGRVVSARGLPVAGAEVAVAHVTSRWSGGSSSRRCAPIFADAAGAFELRGVPRRNVYISVDGGMIESKRFEIPADASGDDVRIDVDVLCRFKLQPRAEEPADDLAVLDADGKTLRLTVHGPRSTTSTDHARRGEDGFPACTVSERAASIVLRQGNRELRRVPIDLHPGELQIIVP